MTEVKEIQELKGLLHNIKERMRNNGIMKYLNSDGKDILVEPILSREELGIMIVDMPEGDFDCHVHDKSIEFGMMLSGEGYARIEFGDGSVKKVQIGEVFVFPKGLSHKWRSVGEKQKVLFVTVPKDIGYP